MAPCNGTQRWHHVHSTIAHYNGTLQWHPAMAPRPLHPAMAFWCHVQCAKVVRRPPPLLEVRTPIAIAIWGTISSLVRNSSNRSRENTKFRIPKVTIITPNCQLFCWGHPSKLGDIPPNGTFWESPWFTVCLRQLQGIKTLNSCVSLCGPKESIQHLSRGSQLPPSTPWSIFLENKCLRSSTSLWCHSDGTFRQLSVFQKGCYQYLLDKKMQEICIMSTSFHSTLVVYPLKQPSRFPQGHCSRDAAACSSAEQGYKDLTHKNSEELKENNDLSSLSFRNKYEKVLMCLSSFIMKYL